MVRKLAGRVVCWTTLVMLAAVSVATAQDGTVKKARKHLLPRYYSKVVTAEQREQINKINSEYQPKIDALESQIAALKKERDEKVSSILTPEQKQKVEEAAAKAKEAKEVKAATSSAVKPADAPATSVDPKKPAK
jgi:Spy/CpxP family protein refolding chaperone